MTSRRIRPWLLTLSLAALAGCNTDQIVRDGLVANDPGRAAATVGRPPVPPESLSISMTDDPPTASPAVAPKPILPKMDDDFRTRRFPEGVAPTMPPATRPIDLKDVPYGRPSIGTTRPAAEGGSQP